MSLRTLVFALWGAFGLYWVIAAFSAKRTFRRRTAWPPGLLILVAFVLLRVFRTHSLVVHSVPLKVVGLILLVAGLGLAVWARIYLGGNWGMPMTEKAEPELVTTGPYRLVYPGYKEHTKMLIPFVL